MPTLLFILASSLLLLCSCKNKTVPADTITQIRAQDRTIECFPVAAVPKPDPSSWSDEKNVPANLKWSSGLASIQPWGSPQAVKGGTFRSTLSTYPNTFRHFGPASNDSFRSYLDSVNLAQYTTNPNSPDDYLPSLCQQWAIADDRKTVYFRLDPSARWSDGHPVLATDYTYLHEVVQDPDMEHPEFKVSFSANIKDIRALGRLSFCIEMQNELPEDEVLYYAGAWPVPRHFWMKFQRDWLAKLAAKGEKVDPLADFGALCKDWYRYFDEAKIAEPVTGPYVIDPDACQTMRTVTFKRVQNWWAASKPWFQGLYNVDAVEFKVIPDVSGIFLNFESANIDEAPMMAPDQWHGKADAKPFIKGWAYRAMGYNDLERPQYGLYLNRAETIEDKPNPLHDIKVREGVCAAMDVDGMLKVVLRGEYARLPRYTSGYRKYDNLAIGPYRFDPDKAAALFVQAGYSKLGADGIRHHAVTGQRLSLTIEYREKSHVARLLWLRQQALKAGLELELKRYEVSTAFKRIKARKCQIAFTGWQGSSLPDYRDSWHSEGASLPESNNTCNYSNAEVDLLISVMETTKSSKEKVAAAHRIQALVHADYCYISTYMLSHVRGGLWNWVKLPDLINTKSNGDLLTEPFAIYGGLFWINEAERRRVLDAKAQELKLNAPLTIIDNAWQSKE